MKNEEYVLLKYIYEREQRKIYIRGFVSDENVRIGRKLLQYEYIKNKLDLSWSEYFGVTETGEKALNEYNIPTN